MSHRYITSGPGIPPAPSPISQAVVPVDHCYVSGSSRRMKRVPSAPDRRDEAEVAFRNLFAALEAAGFSKDDLVYVDLAFVDLGDLAEVNGLYAALFAEDRRPARTVYQVAALPYGGKIKVQDVAVRPRTA